MEVSICSLAVLQGDGTREGSGKCSCNFGYQGELCSECMDEFFAEVQNETHTICQRKSLYRIYIYIYIF